MDFANDENADVLILGGDIFIASELKDFAYDESSQIIPATHTMRARAERYVNFMNRCCERFPQVIYITGNHESYHGDFAESYRIIKGTFGDIKNLHILDKEWRIINGVLFYGGTLWTDMNGEDPNTLYQIAGMMNDYRGVRNSARKVQYRVPSLDESNPDGFSFRERDANFRPEDSVEDHKAFLKGLDEVLALHPNLPTVVVGHHAPSKASTHPRYKNETLVNGAYSTNLDNFILDRRQIVAWTHGHVHSKWCYNIGTTTVFCNPRGYDGYEELADHFKLLHFDIVDGKVVVGDGWSD